MENIFTRFVIIEKYFGRRYYTPKFDCYGNVPIWWASPKMFVSPGIYTSEIDISLFSYDLVASPVFETEFQVSMESLMFKNMKS